MSRRMFIDDELEKHYDELGYVLIDFLNENQIQALNNLYAQYYTQAPSGFFASQYDPNESTKKEIYASILKITDTSIQKYFFETEPFVASFLVKKANSNSEVNPHLDWTFVDESKYSSVTVWCPLVDCDAQNGTLEVVEGSHKLMATLRGSPQLPFAYSGYDLYQYSKLIPVKAGQAVVYNHNAIHASKNNNSNTDRIAIGVGLKPKEAELFHVHQSPDGKLKKFSADASFFHNFSYGSTPDEQFFKEEISFDFIPMDEHRLRRKLGWTVLEQTADSTPIVTTNFFKSLWQKIVN